MWKRPKRSDAPSERSDPGFIVGDRCWQLVSGVSGGRLLGDPGLAG